MKGSFDWVGREAYTNAMDKRRCANYACASPYEGKVAVTKLLVCLAIALLLGGCLPIGARVSNMYVAASASQPH
jgi:hypothetical protein